MEKGVDGEGGGGRETKKREMSRLMSEEEEEEREWGPGEFKGWVGEFWDEREELKEALEDPG
jgi:hypothetical protein